MAEQTRGVRRGAFTFTRGRVGAAVAVAVLAVVGSALRYLTLGYDDFASQPIRPTHAMWPSTDMLRGLDLGYLTAGPGVSQDALSHALDFVLLGATLQQVGMVVAILTVIGLSMDEINKFLWWPLHLAGWCLALGPIALFIGTARWRSLGVDVVVGPGWVPLALDGVLVLVLTFRSWSRIDNYRGF
jgi:hypothetical protein